MEIEEMSESTLIGYIFTDAMLLFLKEKRSKGLTWGKIAQAFNKEFEPPKPKAPDTLRKTYERYKDIDLNPKALISNLKTTHTARLRSSLLAKENKALLDFAVTKDEFIEQLSDVLKSNPIKVHKYVPPKKSAKGKKEACSRTIVGHLSDLHYGTNIDKNEVAGVNQYNWTVSARRTAFFVDQLVGYKSEHRANTDLVLLLNGDLTAGIIHNQEHHVDLMTTQFSGALSYLSQAISYLSQHFKSVRVYATCDNHMRFQHKADKGRSTTQKWDSFATMLYISLKQALKSHKNVEIHYSETPFIVADIQGHKALITHSDTVFNTGNVGKKIDTGMLKAQINDFNTNRKDNEKVDVVFLGHHHTALMYQLDNGVFLMMNGCMSGVDPFAQSIGIGLTSSQAIQQIVEIVPNYIGDVRFVQTQKADDNEKWDLIIHPLTTKFI
jgi:hypothetical protein